jgi:transcriptional regulator with XRE-family HTH domain
MQANDGVDVLVRRRLREVRMQRAMTLEDVARRAQIDVSRLLMRAPEAEDPRVRGSSHTPVICA